MKQSLKGKLVFLLFLVLVFGQKIKSQKSQFNKKHQQQYEFQKFKKIYGKSYESSEHESYRFNVFLENQKQALKLKKEISTAEFGVTQFSDQTEEEFMNVYANGVISSNNDTFESYIQSTSDSQLQIPKQWDIRINGPGYMQPVQNQGGCGSCWAFTVVSTIENLYSIKYNKNFTLSEQQLIDCDHFNNGCNGGWFTSAYRYVQENGLALFSRYPYIGDKKNCLKSQVGELYKINGYEKLPSDTESIKQYLVQKGAIATCVYVNQQWQTYRNGILQTNYLGTQPCNKAVTVIGYGTKDNIDFWILRNTWGTAWGEDGHIRVSMKGLYNINVQAVFQPI
ncbi:hypothetical protein ABPG74_018393 [Tetrahymena malaccensis]